MPNFWRVPLPGEQSNPRSRQYIYRFPDSRTVFWSNPENTLPVPDLRTKIQSFIIFQIQEALWRNLNNLKPSFSRIKSFTFQREVKENALASLGQIMPTGNNNKPQKINMRATTSQYQIHVAKISFAQSKPFSFRA